MTYLSDRVHMTRFWNRKPSSVTLIVKRRENQIMYRSLKARKPKLPKRDSQIG